MKLKDVYRFNKAKVLAGEEWSQKLLGVHKCGDRTSKRKQVPDELPHADIVPDIPEREEICGCGAEPPRIGLEVFGGSSLKAQAMLFSSSRQKWRYGLADKWTAFVSPFKGLRHGIC
jgi:hypothetical protein